MDSARYGYARVSKADETQNNLEVQIQGLLTHGIRRDLIYTDISSGGRMDRPGWMALMKVVQSGDTVVVMYLDRFARNIRLGLECIAQLREAGIGIESVHEGLNTLSDNPADQLQVSLFLSFADWFRQSTAQRIKEGQTEARRKGKTIGRPAALSQDQVDFVRQAYAEGRPKAWIARFFGVSRPVIYKIIAEMEGY